MDAPPPRPPRQRDSQPAPAQRSRHRRRRRRIGHHGRRRPGRGLPVRQRRAHRQCRSGHPRTQSLHARHRAGARFFRHQRHRPHRRTLHRLADPSPPSLCRRPGVHRLLRLASGRDQERLCRAKTGCDVERALHAGRSGRSRSRLRLGDSRQQPVRQGRRGVFAGNRIRHRHAAPPAGSVFRRSAAPYRPPRRRDERGRSLDAVFRHLPHRRAVRALRRTPSVRTRQGAGHPPDHSN